MVPLYFALRSDFALTIIPDTAAHLDGHTIITHTYSLFRSTDNENPLLFRSRESKLNLEKIDDPDYCGYITFEMPDKLFSYTADGNLELSREDLELTIEFLSHIRTNPALWKNIDK